jgi:cysteinyl-tRNA synthetase
VSLRLHNTLTRTTEEFVPITPGSASMYTCGPTVYDFAHIGNLRTYVFEDVLRRALEQDGLAVRHVMNVTDVGHLTDDADHGEDKMLKSSREKGMSVWDIAAFYTESFFRHFREVGCRMPHEVCRATAHVPEMIQLIQRIEARGFTYFAGGNLYFDISRFPAYGKMALLDMEELRAGARIDVDPNKRNPHDFVLWFTQSKFAHQAMLWDSPWGRGYPGWHIECSAMSMKYLGEHFDIHCGGIDHIPVHHTNEIAQSEAATGRKWVNYWLHGEFLLMAKAKMAKSAGNFITLDTLKEQGYHPLDYRYLLLTAHYRSQLQFGYEALEAAKSARRNMTERIGKLKADLGVEQEAALATTAAAGTPPGDSEGADRAASCLDRFRGYIQDDLNVPRALAEAWGLLKDESIGAAARLRALYAMDAVLGLDFAGAKVESLEVEEGILARIRDREAARKGRDFALADRIRDELRGDGIVLEDTSEGVRWRKA